MRSTRPVPGRWPHDMVLTIEDSPHALHELLWIREAWQLRVAGDELPPPLADSPAIVDADRPDSFARWQAAWPGLWHSCLAHAAGVRDPSDIERLRHSALGSPERAMLLSRLRGPSWRDEFGNDAFTPGFDAWSRTQFDALTRRRPRSLGDTPERRCLDALVPAWRAGLAQLVLIPCRGTFTRRVGTSALLLTEETRNDPARYEDALRSFT